MSGSAGNVPRAHGSLDLCRVETGLLAVGKIRPELDICSLGAALRVRDQIPLSGLLHRPLSAPPKPDFVTLAGMYILPQRGGHRLKIVQFADSSATIHR